MNVEQGTPNVEGRPVFHVEIRHSLFDIRYWFDCALVWESERPGRYIKERYLKEIYQVIK